MRLYHIENLEMLWPSSYEYIDQSTWLLYLEPLKTVFVDNPVYGIRVIYEFIYITNHGWNHRSAGRSMDLVKSKRGFAEPQYVYVLLLSYKNAKFSSKSIL